MTIREFGFELPETLKTEQTVSFFLLVCLKANHCIVIVVVMLYAILC